MNSSICVNKKEAQGISPEIAGDDAMDKLEEKSPELISLCLNCGKKIGQIEGSLTAWLFRESRCACKSPAGLLEITQEPLDLQIKNPQEPALPDLGAEFKILSRLGQGGMGAVYLAEDPQGSKYAIKVLSQALASDPESLIRFKREAEAASGLLHENLVRVHGCRFTCTQTPFILMDYISGISLDRYISENGPLDSLSLQTLFIQLARALVYMHSMQVIHRDLKPSNVMLCEIEGSLHAKIVDFGIAQITNGQNTQHTVELTRTGELIGSPPYMSPEQCMGQQLTACSDIYSLACLIFHAAQGNPPFEAANPVQIIVKHLHEEAPSLTKINKTIPRPIAEIIKRCLKKDPADRYRSASELLADLERFAAGRPISPSKFKWKTLFSRQSAGIAAAAGLTLVTINLAPFFLSKPNIELSKQWHELDTHGQKEFDKGHNTKAKEFFQKSLEIARQQKSPVFEESSLNELIDISRASGRETDAESIVQQLALINQSDKILKKLENRLEQAINQSNRSSKDELRNLCAQANDIAVSLMESQDLSAAKKILSLSNEIAEKRLSQDLVLIRTIHNLGSLAQQSGDYEGAIAAYKKAIALEDSIKGADDLKAKTLRLLARSYLQTSRPAEEIELLFQQCLNLTRRLYGAQSPELASVRYEMANFFLESGKINMARDELETAISLYKRSDSSDQSSLAKCYSLLGLINHDQKLCLEALSILEEETRKNYPELALVLVRISKLKLSTEPQEALILANRVEAITKRFSQRDRYFYKSELLSIAGHIDWRADQLDKAESKLRKSLELKELIHPKTSMAVLEGRASLAALLVQKSNYKEAELLYDSALKLLSLLSDSPAKEKLQQTLLRGKDYLLKKEGSEDSASLTKVLP